MRVTSEYSPLIPIGSGWNDWGQNSAILISLEKITYNKYILAVIVGGM